MQIYLHKDGKQIGPHSIDQLRQYLELGYFEMSDLACYDGQNWVRISEIPGIAPPPPTANNDGNTSRASDETEERLPKVEREVSRVIELMEKANKFLHLEEAEVSLNQARKAAEAICKQVYVNEGFEKKGKQADRLMLDEFITRFNQETNNGNAFMPRIILKYLETIKTLGNLGSHDQGEESEYITTETATQCLQALSSVVSWYTKDYHNVSTQHWEGHAAASESNSPTPEDAKEEMLMSYAEALEEAWTLYDQGNYEEAKSLAREAYEGSLALEGESLAPEDRVLYLRTLCNISQTLRENEEVIDLATEVLAYATDPLDTSFANTHIGQAYDNKGDYDKAIIFLEEALAINLEHLDPKDPTIAKSYNDLGWVYFHKQEHATAIEHYNYSLSIALESDPNDPEIAMTYSNIGLAYGGLEDQDQALLHHEKSLEMNLQNFGTEHPKVGVNYNNIGLTCSDKGADGQAIAYYEKALAIYLESFGADHPEVAITYANLGVTYYDKGDKPNALSYMLQAKAILLKRLGPNHPDTLNTQDWIDSM